MIENKKKEFQEINDLIDQHNAQVAAELGIDVPSDEELQKIGQEDMTPAIIGTKYYDQSDGFGRARKTIKSSPLEERAAKENKTIDQLVSGSDNPVPSEITLADGTTVKSSTTDNSSDIKKITFEKEEEELNKKRMNKRENVGNQKRKEENAEKDEKEQDEVGGKETRERLVL